MLFTFPLVTTLMSPKPPFNELTRPFSFEGWHSTKANILYWYVNKLLAITDPTHLTYLSRLVIFQQLVWTIMFRSLTLVFSIKHVTISKFDSCIFNKACDHLVSELSSLFVSPSLSLPWLGHFPILAPVQSQTRLVSSCKRARKSNHILLSPWASTLEEP